MRCYACQKILSDHETSLKGSFSGEYLDMCVKCLKEADISYFSEQFDDNEIDIEDSFDEGEQ